MARVAAASANVVMLALLIVAAGVQTLRDVLQALLRREGSVHVGGNVAGPAALVAYVSAVILIGAFDAMTRRPNQTNQARKPKENQENQENNANQVNQENQENGPNTPNGHNGLRQRLHNGPEYDQDDYDNQENHENHENQNFAALLLSPAALMSRSVPRVVRDTSVLVLFALSLPAVPCLLGIVRHEAMVGAPIMAPLRHYVVAAMYRGVILAVAARAAWRGVKDIAMAVHARVAMYI